MTFEKKIILKTIDRLIEGKDYREEIIQSINAIFLDFTINFFKEIVKAKINSESITIDWYKKYFINDNNFDSNEVAIFAGLNKKTITNVYGHVTKNIVINAANENFEYLAKLISELEKDEVNGININITLSYHDVNVNLSLVESLIVINAIATKKIQIRGGAWSSIGKEVEKPLIDKLCELAGVDKKNIDNSHFHKDKKKLFDREVDYKLISKSGRVYRIEVKLMGHGNPESADATIARDSDIFIADTLSDQNKSQLESLGIKYLVLKNNLNSLNDFKKILNELDIPYSH